MFYSDGYDFFSQSPYESIGFFTFKRAYKTKNIVISLSRQDTTRKQLKFSFCVDISDRRNFEFSGLKTEQFYSRLDLIYLTKQYKKITEKY